MDEYLHETSIMYRSGVQQKECTTYKENQREITHYTTRNIETEMEALQFV